MRVFTREIRSDAFVLLAVLLAFILSLFLSHYYLKDVGNELSKEFVGIEMVLDTDSFLNPTLAYTFDAKFSSKKVLNNITDCQDTLKFLFPKTDSIVTKIRVDFGNRKHLDPFKIRSMTLLFENRNIHLNEQEVFEKLENTSASIILDKENRSISFNNKVNPFDPYLVFSPIIESTFSKTKYGLFLVLPFLLAALLLLAYNWEALCFNFEQFLLFAFIVCIPLKIAWSTFVALLLCLKGIFGIIMKKGKVLEWPLFFFFGGFFVLLLLLGRPSSIEDFNMQSGLLLWAVISIAITFNKTMLFKAYVWFFLFFHAVVIASAIVFLISFNDLYGLDILDFFKNLKLFGRDIRNWLYYDHAAFLSFFGSIGTLFLHKLYKEKGIKTSTVIVYHALLLVFIIISATRIGFIIYFLVATNALVPMSHKVRLSFNSLFVIVFASILFIGIKMVDRDREILWETTVVAIKERPLFGYGLGQSENVLQERFQKKSDVGLPLLELNHSHNQYLTYFLELGALGTFVLAMAFVVFLMLTKQWRNDILMVYVFATLLLFLTESPLQTSKPLHVLSYLLILAFSHTGSFFPSNLKKSPIATLGPTKKT